MKINKKYEMKINTFSNMTIIISLIYLRNYNFINVYLYQIIQNLNKFKSLYCNLLQQRYNIQMKLNDKIYLKFIFRIVTSVYNR